MENSLITKKIIAYSLKKIMTETPFQKVTIRQIMETADIRRQTFYDHFQDKYELLAWIYRQEISENIQDFLDYEEWQNVIFRILNYFEQNQFFYRNALAVSEKNSFDYYFFEHTQNLLKTIIETQLKNQSLTNPNAQQLDFTSIFYSHAFVSVSKEWILSGCKKDATQLAKAITSTLEKSISGVLHQNR